MLVDQKADEKTCDWVAKDDYRNWGGGGWGGSCCYLLPDEPLSAGDVIT